MKIKGKIKEELKDYLDKKLKDEDSKALVVSSYPLSQDDLELLKKEIPIFKNQNNIENLVDESILAGLIIKIGTKMIDLSLKGKLSSLKKQMYEIA